MISVPLQDQTGDSSQPGTSSADQPGQSHTLAAFGSIDVPQVTVSPSRPGVGPADVDGMLARLNRTLEQASSCHKLARAQGQSTRLAEIVGRLQSLGCRFF